MFKSLKIICIFVFLKNTMLQRIQTVYLLIASLVSGGLIFFLSLWKNGENVSFFVIEAFKTENVLLIAMSMLFFISAFISICTLFLFRNRNLQLVFGRLNILINFILLGIVVYFSQNLSGETVVSEKGIGLLIPIFNIVLVVLANNAIKRDEALVKSVDRLR